MVPAIEDAREESRVSDDLLEMKGFCLGANGVAHINCWCRNHD